MKIIIDTDKGNILAQSIGLIDASKIKTYSDFIKEVQVQPKPSAGSLNRPNKTTPTNTNSIRQDMLSRQRQTIQNQIERLQSQLNNLGNTPAVPSLPSGASSKATTVPKKANTPQKKSK